MVKILIVTNPGFFNKGDAALILGALKTLRKIYGSEVSLLTSNPEFEHSRCDATLISITNPSKKRNSIVGILRYSILMIQHILLSVLYRILRLRYVPPGTIEKKILEEYYNSDIIIAGIDDSFTTLYGPGPFLTNFRAILLAKILKKSVVLYAGSVGPFRNKYYEILGSYIINQADLVTLREEISLDYLKEIGVSNPSMNVTADLAFALHASSSDKAKEILTSEGIDCNEFPLIGISLSRVISKWAFPDVQEPAKKYHEYTTIMARVIDYLIEELSATLIFIPQVIGPAEKDDDRNAAEDICRIAKNQNKIKLITNEYTPEELRDITGLFDLFIGARTHSVISAAVMCVPFVAIEYASHKTRGIIGNMLDCEEFVYDIGTLDYNTLIAKINDVWSNREKIRDELKFKIEGMEERALLNGKLVEDLVVKK